MIIKDKIQIGGIWWKIRFVNDLKIKDNPDYKEYEGTEVYGAIRYSEHVIELNSSYNEEKQFIALIHELRHAVYDMTGYEENERVKLDEGFIIRQQHYDHQIIKQIVEWQVSK